MTKLLVLLLSAGFVTGQGMFPLPGGHAPLSAGAWPNGYAKCGTITIQAVGSTLTNFPVRFFTTQAGLASVGNGGVVTDAQGDDIVMVVSTSDGTPIPFQLMSWDATTGAVEIVVAATLSTSTTNVVMCAGNSMITSYQGSTSTWDSSHVGVWPLNNNAASTLISEYTSHGNDGTNNVNTSGVSMTGPYEGGTLGKALDYNGSTDFTSLTSSSDYQMGSQFTWQMWLKPGTMSNFLQILDRSNYPTFTEGYFLTLGNQGILSGSMRAGTSGAGGATMDSTTGMTSGQWSCVAFKKEAGMNNGFFTVDGMTNQNGFFTPITGSHTLFLAKNQDASLFFDGAIADLRISSVERSQDWIDATCDNGSSPSTFAAVGTLVAP